MKGKNTFTQLEISELRSLIRERIKAERSRQKSIRARMRRIGFYGSHDFGFIDLQPEDFDRLISSGRIKVLGQGSLPKKEEPKKTVNEKLETTSPLKSSREFNLFDPEIHASNHISDNPGNYIVCLKKGSVLPDIGISCVMKTYQELNVVYTGIAGKSLRKRDYRQHFTGNNAGRSTLRKSLGSMFGYTKIARDRDPSTGKTKFNESDEKKLSEWMQSNLVLFFKSNLNPQVLEEELINELNPPLNLDKNKHIINHDFRRKISELRCKK